MSISKFQYFSKYDRLRDFKIAATQKYSDCSFFEHQVNAPLSLNNGVYDGKQVREKIITNGNISLSGFSSVSPSIIWQNSLITLDSGKSIEITIDNVNYIIVQISFGNEIHYEIHSVNEDSASLTSILDLIYTNNGSNHETSSITFKSPSILLLETQLNNKKITEELNLKNGNSKIR